MCALCKIIFSNKLDLFKATCSIYLASLTM